MSDGVYQSMLGAQSALSRFESAIDEVYELFEKYDQTIVSNFSAKTEAVNEVEKTLDLHLRLIRSRVLKMHADQESSAGSIKNHTQVILSGKRRIHSHTKLRILSAIKDAKISASKSTAKFVSNLPKHILIQVNREAFESSLRTLRNCIGAGLGYVLRSPDSIQDPVAIVGQKGNGPLGFVEPFGIAIHPRTGNIYVMNKDRQKIDVLSPQLTYLHELRPSSPESKGYGLSYPRGLSFDDQGTTLIAVDTLNHRIQLITPEGELIKVFGKNGTSAGHFRYPQVVTVDCDNFFYVADKDNNRVQKFSLNGDFICAIGESSSEKPAGEVGAVLINNEQELMTMSVHSSVVRVYTRDGQFLRDINVDQTGSPTNGFSNYLARGPFGGFVVSDSSGYVKIYDKEGKKLKEIQIPVPIGTTFDESGRLLVVSYELCNITAY